MNLYKNYSQENINFDILKCFDGTHVYMYKSSTSVIQTLPPGFFHRSKKIIMHFEHRKKNDNY